jgi:tetratricopeptide (TPR) repeat protein
VDNNWTVPVLAAGLAVISQADLLPYRDGVRLQLKTRLWRSALALLLLGVWLDAAFISSVGLHFNEAGLRAFAKEDLAGAEVSHRYAVGFLPEHPVLLDNLGTVYFTQFLRTRKPEHLDRSEIFFSEAMRQNPYSELSARHLERVLIQRLTGDPRRDAPIHQRIVETNRRALTGNPFNPFVRKNLAEALYHLGEREQAYEELLKAVAMEPNYVPGYLRLAAWSQEMGRSEDSDKYRKQAIQVVHLYKDKKFADVFENLLLGRPVAEQP